MDKQFLEQCEGEALHLSGAIQPHGTLLVTDKQGRISHAAANVADFLAAPPEAWLGQPLPEELASLVATGLALQAGSRAACIGALDRGLGRLDAVANRGEAGSVILELTRHLAHPAEASAAAWEAPANSLESEAALAAARQGLVERIAELSGFQRVMYYAFCDDGDGEVVAEARQGDAFGSYLGLRFPASDIPRIARRLYLKNPWRSIPDAIAEPVSIHGHAAQTPDLTWSDLRSVSLMHRVYLANMGVRASLSLPVVIGGALGALVAAHHREAVQLPLAVLEFAAALVRAHALAVMAHQSARRMGSVEGFCRRMEQIPGPDDLPSAWPDWAPRLMGEFQADGATLCLGTTALAAGRSFEPPALAVFDAWFCQQQGDTIWMGDSLCRQVPCYPASEISGALALRLPIGAGPGLRLYLARVEHIQKVAWGGNPEKPMEIRDGILNIAPRRSFEKWVEKRLGCSLGWERETCLLLAFRLQELLMGKIRR